MNRNILILLLFQCILINSAYSFGTGSETLLANAELLQNKNIALVTNKSAILSNGKHLVDELLLRQVNIAKIFTPEHGFSVNDVSSLNYSSIPVISLYDSKKSFSEDDLKGIDIVIYDIQDLGVRFYTYISTLYLTMSEAGLNNIEYYVCDRPSIANLNYCGGFYLDEKYKSFVGTVPVPICYGMTTGELSLYIKDILMQKNIDINLSVFKMSDYSRLRYYPDLNLTWVNTSPSITSFYSGAIYPATCFLEGTNISEGRGSEIPFQQFGAPFIDNEKLLVELENMSLDGVKFEKSEFTPSEIVSAFNPKYFGKKCYGVKIILTDFLKFKPIETGISILTALKRSTPNFEWINKNFIDKLAGTDRLRKMIDSDSPTEDIFHSWKDDLEKFEQLRKKYLLYN